jgi:hypothetical protein
LAQQEAGSDAAKDSEVTDKKEEVIAAEVETKTEEPAAVEAPPAQIELSNEVCAYVCVYVHSACDEAGPTVFRY